MTALAQGSAGLALVMCFALLATRQVSAAALLLVAQSSAVAVTAMALHQPMIAAVPFLLAAGFWLLRHKMPMFHPRTEPVGGAKLAIGAGAALVILCQSQGTLALPCAIILLSILLAATRSHPLMQLAALVGMQNGITLAACLAVPAATPPASLLVPIACLPLPLAAGLMVSAVASSPNRQMPRAMTSWLFSVPGTAIRAGWIDIGIALAIFAATLIVPLDSLASVFAPLLGLDAVLRSFTRRRRYALTPIRRATTLLQSGFVILAVSGSNPVTAWLAVLGAIAAASPATMSRRWTGAVLAYLAAGLGLFGTLILPGGPSLIGYFSLFLSFVTIAAVIPDLAIVLVIMMLRLANQESWPIGVEALGIGMAMISLLACGILLINPHHPHRIALLVLAQASIAALTISIGQAEGRFVALTVLILLILSRAAARAAVGPVAVLAVAGLGGLPPLGMFPGLVLAVLTISADQPWLLLPLGAALVPIVSASIPRRLPDFVFTGRSPSIAWLPMLLAVAVGFFAPDGLVRWWRVLTLGHT